MVLKAFSDGRGLVREGAPFCGPGNLTRCDTLAWLSLTNPLSSQEITPFVASRLSSRIAGTRSFPVHSRPSIRSCGMDGWKAGWLAGRLASLSVTTSDLALAEWGHGADMK